MSIHVGDLRQRRRSVAILTNVLIDPVRNSRSYGGGERYIWELIKLLKTNNFHVEVFQKSNEPSLWEHDGVSIHGLNSESHIDEFDVGLSNEFYSRSHVYDHVIYNLPEVASGQMRDDALLICHGIWFDTARSGGLKKRSKPWIENFDRAFSNPCRIICVDYNSFNVLRSWDTMWSEKIVCIPNFVDSDLFKPAEMEERQRRIVIPRRLHEARGVEVARDLLAAIPDDWTVLWVGQDASHGRYSSFLRELGAADKRFDLTSVTFEEMPALYRESQICVIPTMASEGTSLACLEALASGCVVVSTFVGGLSNIIIDGHNGVLCAPKYEAIAGSTCELVTNPERMSALSSNARNSALKFDLAKWKSRWVTLLHELNWL